MKLYAIGVGPGDKKLITYKGVEALKCSDVVYVPQSDETGRSIAYDIIKEYVPSSKIKTYYFPMNNNKEELDKRYTHLADEIKKDVKNHLIVSYVTIGDPLIYSTFNYLNEKLTDVDIEVIPGITSFLAASALIKDDIVQKNQSFCIIEPEQLKDFDTISKLFDTIIVMKAYRGITQICDIIKKHRSIKKAHLVIRAGLDDERVVDLLNTNEPIEKTYLSIALIKLDKDAGNTPYPKFTVKGSSIEKESFQIINDLVDLSKFKEDEREIVTRIIHASGDLSLADDIIFSPDWRWKIKTLLNKTPQLITDVEMVKVGIGKRYPNVSCFINDPDVIETAHKTGQTRAEVAIKKGFELFEDIIFCIGNAPTALLKVIELSKYNTTKDIFVIGMPVGFVSAKESKELLERSRLPSITIKGFKGGSPIAAATFNAIWGLFGR
ncbi:MAG: precorrin-2 C(20)-methyltransferase [Calditerrivibrio sp.]|nr:precorrin-2 C(20)-methyltransferase [Calditerrivibrio sp.]